MNERIYNKNGIPLLSVGNKAFISTTGSNIKTVKEKTDNTFSYKEKKYIEWGDANNYPDEAEKTIVKTGVLQTGLNYKSRCCYGQGVMPVKVDGFDEKGNEIITIINDAEILNYLRGYAFRNYHTTAFRDLIKFANCFPLFVFNQDFTKILRVDIINARHCRLSEDKKKLLVFGGFSDGLSPDDTTVVYDVLDEADPFLDLTNRKLTGQIKNHLAFPRIKNYFSNNDYYGTPDWEAANKAGWIEIAHKIPTFLKKAYSNAMSLMWHVQIPYEFFDKKFPEKDYKNEDERQSDIDKYLDSIENSLIGEENAHKALMTFFSNGENGKIDDGWKIERLKNEIEAAERLSTSAAANSEILFSLMVNPSVLGAGMPGGPYSGNAGSGSDIREGLLVSMILSHIEKQQVLDPIELMLQFNGCENVELKYRNIILTTLDSGNSTSEKLT